MDRGNKLALLWRRDAPKWQAATAENYRLHRVFEELAALGIQAEPALYADNGMEKVRKQLPCCDGVMVWADPLADGENRIMLDALLRDVASNRVWVSAHPDVILKMGVKEALHRAKHLGWGMDTHLYRSVKAFHAKFPGPLRSAGPHVLKRNRGNGGQGVWKVELTLSPTQIRPG